MTSVLEEGGCRSRMSGSSAPAILWSGRGERNPRVHTLDAAWKRGEGSNSAEDTDGINYSVSISMPPGFHPFHFLPILTEASFRVSKRSLSLFHFI